MCTSNIKCLAVPEQNQFAGSLVCSLPFHPVRFTPLTSPCNKKQAVVGIGCFALEPSSANPSDGDDHDHSGGGGDTTHKVGRELLKCCGGWHKAKKCSSKKALFQTYIYDFTKKKNQNQTQKLELKRQLEERSCWSFPRRLPRCTMGTCVPRPAPWKGLRPQSRAGVSRLQPCLDAALSPKTPASAPLLPPPGLPRSKL